MTTANLARPDVTLLLDAEGLIQEVTVSDALSQERVDTWIGHPWIDTVADVGGDKVKRMVEGARTSRVSVFRQLTQRFPSGLEVLMEYTTVRLGDGAGLLAIGRSLQAVAELQSRLIAAQQAMERDYWRLREIETRYRLIFNASSEAVLMLKAATLRIVEANPAAIHALGLALQPEAIAGREILAQLEVEERQPLQAMLQRVREQGKAPGFLMHLGPEREPWVVRASLIKSETGPVFLLQLAPVWTKQFTPTGNEPIAIEKLIERAPDGFVVLNSEGVILSANPALLDMVQVGSEQSVVGERLGRWLGRPGADLTVLLATVQRHGVVRLFSTIIHGELGTDTEVEISATGNVDTDPQHYGVLLRDVGCRLTSPSENKGLSALLDSLSERVGKTTLRKLVEEAVAVVERHYIDAALELTGGNRTAAAELLGLSRQSLYAKLDRYRIDGNAEKASDLSN
ncbi:MAG: transcriptional regulator PpsR [Gammaproteobacteria bacterium]